MTAKRQQEEKLVELESFRQVTADVLACSGNCEASRAMLAAATSIPMVVQMWRSYWQGVLDEVPAETVAAFEAHYASHRDEINSAGVYFNEDGPREAIVLVGNLSHTLDGPSPAPLPLSRCGHIYVLGRAHVVVSDTAAAHCDHPAAVLELRGHARGELRRGRAVAYEYSRLFVSGVAEVECHDASQVIVNNVDATVIDFGHRRLDAPAQSIKKMTR